MKFKTRLAHWFCKLAHFGQKRKYTGAPYWTHPFEVARIASIYVGKDEVYIAALLHDTIEDTWVKPWMIEKLFGPWVLKLVLEVTDVSTPADGNRAARKAKDLEHLKNASYWGRHIKLCDLYDNSKSILYHDPGFAKIYLKEKAQILAEFKKQPNNETLFENCEELVIHFLKRAEKTPEGAKPTNTMPIEDFTAVYIKPASRAMARALQS